MLRIRLRRMGARNRPHYRIVVSDSRRTARAEVLEEIGAYDPMREPTIVSFDTAVVTALRSGSSR